MDFTRIKNLIRGNGEKLILVENGEPEVVVMSFSEYARIAGAGVAASAAPMPVHSSAIPAYTEQAGHATDELFDMPSHDEWQGVDTGEETQLVMDEWSKSEARSAAHDTPIRLADIRLEDLPI